MLSKEFPSAEIVGVEPKPDNYGQCLKSATDRIKFIKKDCRNLRNAEMGTFDFVWCFGLIYHLEDPIPLMSSLVSITHSQSLICIDGHIAIDGEQTYSPSPSSPIRKTLSDGCEYYGKVYQGLPEDSSETERDKFDRASLDNPWSFWLTYESILDLFRRSGFCQIVEIRCDLAQSLFGPGLILPSVDPDREWSRRLFVLSRETILTNSLSSSV